MASIAETAAFALTRCDFLTTKLARTDWRPSRTDVEQDRNLIRDLATALLPPKVDVAADGVVPTAPGSYWAKWRIAEDGTREGDELTPSDQWEVMTVVGNSIDAADPEHLMVSVPGVEKSQPRENFFWAKPIRALPLPGRG